MKRLFLELTVAFLYSASQRELIVCSVSVLCLGTFCTLSFVELGELIKGNFRGQNFIF